LLPGNGSTRYFTIATVSPYFKDKENGYEGYDDKARDKIVFEGDDCDNITI
jgi:hypothetical protein